MEYISYEQQTILKKYGMLDLPNEFQDIRIYD